MFLLCPHVLKGATELCGTSFIRAQISIMKTLASWPNHLPEHHTVEGRWFQGMITVWLVSWTHTRQRVLTTNTPYRLIIIDACSDINQHLSSASCYNTCWFLEQAIFLTQSTMEMKYLPIQGASHIPIQVTIPPCSMRFSGTCQAMRGSISSCSCKTHLVCKFPLINSLITRLEQPVSFFGLLVLHLWRQVFRPGTFPWVSML